MERDLVGRAAKRQSLGIVEEFAVCDQTAANPSFQEGHAGQCKLKMKGGLL
jgi:hypothetical protein